MDNLDNDAPDSELQDKVETYMEALVKLERFHGSVLIARDGSVLFSKGYGLANREHQAPNTPQTRFRLGSITKQFTAMALLILQERGLLNVHDPISAYVDDSPAAWQPITIHHLLNHTAGLPNVTSFVDWQTTARSPLTVARIIELFKAKPLEFPPGERQNYSNSGYILLGHIIEKVSGKSYEEFLQEAILTPLAMPSTGYDHGRTILPNRAAGYGKQENLWVNADYLDMGFPYAAGALYSTTEDLLKWDQALTTEQLVSKPTLDSMCMGTPFLTNYGYGVDVGREFDRKVIRHGGGMHGFRTHLARFVEDKICIVVLSNLEATRPEAISRDLAAMVFGEKVEIPEDRQPIPLAPQIYEAYVGEYELAPQRLITIRRKDDRLLAQATGALQVELLPASETEFFRRGTEDQVTFVRDDSGQVRLFSCARVDWSFQRTGEA